MSAIATAFDEAEFPARVARLQAEMAAGELDALLLTTAPDVFYVTGFLTRFWESPTRPWFVIVPARGDPVAVVPAIGEALMRRTWLADVRCWDSPRRDAEGLGLLAEALRAVVSAGGRIGVPMGPETHLRMPLAYYEALLRELAPRRVVDATAALHRTREIKSEAEIERARQAASIAGRAFDAMAGFAGAGRPLDAVFRDFQSACLAAGADWVGYLAGGAGPGGYDDVISLPSQRPLAAGDLLMIDTGVVSAGYFCDYDRNLAIGRADDGLRRAYDTLFAATEAGIDAARPGARAAEVHAAIERTIVAAGGEPLVGRFGHGLGISLTEWPSFMPGDETLLREGMVLTIEPGLEIAPGRIMVHEENIVLRAAGAELLSPRAPAELPVVS